MVAKILPFIKGVFIFFALLIAPSCHSEDPFKVRDDEIVINILSIGNSYSRDAFSYVPPIIEQSVKGVRVNLDILQIGGVGLEKHLDAILNNTPDFTFDHYQTEIQRWKSDYSFSIGDLWKKKKWDIIVLQDGTVSSLSYDKTFDNVSRIIEIVRQYNPNARYCFMIIPTHAAGTSVPGNYSSDEEFDAISDVAGRLKDNHIVDDIIPCGTAIQLARKTYLDRLGDFGHLSYEGRHLQEGIPCYIEALTASQFIMDFFNVKGSIEDCPLIVDQQWVTDKSIPGQHGLVISGSSDDYALCKRCALNAIASPLFCDFVIQPVRDKYPSLFPAGDFILEAHRGFSDEYPENTEIAFRSAGDIQAYKAIETDIQMTKDDELVCMHDERIDRTTNGEGKVSDYKLSELQSFWISGGYGWNDEYKEKLTVPTFETYLNICSAYGKTPYVELKSLSDKGVKKTIELLHSKGFKDGSFVLTSFDLHCLVYASSICKTPLEYMKSASFTDQEIADFSKMENFILRPPVSMVTKEFVDLCHAWGVSVEAYGIGVNNRAQVDNLQSWGVLGGTCNSWKKLGFDE